MVRPGQQLPVDAPRSSTAAGRGCSGPPGRKVDPRSTRRARNGPVPRLPPRVRLRRGRKPAGSRRGAARTPRGSQLRWFAHGRALPGETRSRPSSRRRSRGGGSAVSGVRGGGGRFLDRQGGEGRARRSPQRPPAPAPGGVPSSSTSPTFATDAEDLADERPRARRRRWCDSGTSTSRPTAGPRAASTASLGFPAGPRCAADDRRATRDGPTRSSCSRSTAAKGLEFDTVFVTGLERRTSSRSRTPSPPRRWTKSNGCSTSPSSRAETGVCISRLGAGERTVGGSHPRGGRGAAGSRAIEDAITPGGRRSRTGRRAAQHRRRGATRLARAQRRQARGPRLRSTSAPADEPLYAGAGRLATSASSPRRQAAPAYVIFPQRDAGGRALARVRPREQPALLLDVPGRRPP